MTKDHRIELLDSFRFFAILSVMLFHYYSLWFPPFCKTDIYPYGNLYDNFSLGYLGVQFFFIISGFVIAFTLTRTNSFREFIVKRMIRLLPPIILCSLLTFVVFNLIDTYNILPNVHSVTNLLCSMTLLPPALLNKCFSAFSLHADYIDGSYWSLWPEVQFYFVASTIYFLNKKKFINNLFLFNVLLLVLNYIFIRIMANSQTTNKFHLSISPDFIQSYNFWTQSVFNYIQYSLFFLLGVLFFNIYTKGKGIKSLSLVVIVVLLQYFLFYRSENMFDYKNLIICFMILLFLVFSISSKSIDFLAVKPITNIGIASYSLYLIHQSLGLLLINKYAQYMGKYNFLFPVIVIFIMIFFCLYSYKYIEKPIGLLLKKKMVK